MILSATAVSLYGPICLGLMIVFSAMGSTCSIFLQTSCFILQAILLYRCRDSVLPIRDFSLGDFGAVVNATAVAWVVFLDIIYCFPTVIPLIKENMNYISVVVTELVSFAVGLWLTSKNGRFIGLKIDVAQLTEWRMATINKGHSHGKD